MTQFPFNFILELSYTLEENTLTCAYKITNSGANTLPFSVGAHPGFNCPLLPEENFEDYYLELDGSHFSVTSLNNGLRTKNKSSLVLEDNRLALHSALFDWDALVFENQQIEKISLCSKKSSHRISMTCEGWPYFGIWSKKGCREFICLEPWFGVADKENASSDFFKKEGLIFLKAQEVFECQFSISCS
jgi:galactose mutarotase-like enzyme